MALNNLVKWVSVDVLIFQTLVAAEGGIEQQHKPRSD